MTSVSSRRIRPPVTGRNPASASANSRWPLPETPAIPTISPPRTSMEKLFTARLPRSPST